MSVYRTGPHKLILFKCDVCRTRLQTPQPELFLAKLWPRKHGWTAKMGGGRIWKNYCNPCTQAFTKREHEKRKAQRLKHDLALGKYVPRLNS